ncbi:MAG TPA: glucan biosynthesis protein G [Nevskiaceae bacterium]|nr:glucan biosynthesis protein G [Nevskiaceae bacterium]
MIRNGRFVFCALLSLPLLLAAGTAGAAPFTFEDVAKKAQALAAQPYKQPDSPLPKELLDLTYDQYRDIRFRTDKSLWRNRNLPFEIQFFHPGLYFRHPVRINLINREGASPYPFRSNQFDYGRLNPQLDPSKYEENIGFAGFRVHFNLNNPGYKDEVVVFQGASYFRALGKEQRYGLSARGLAVDTAMLSGEEFPTFTEFWLAWPSAKDQHLVVYALLDSKRVTGAYRFEIVPGATTVMNVQGRVFLRESVAKLGLAPLTSMFFFGENQRSGAEDYRPEVHDSDGLMMQLGNGEWLWRPLVNPRRLLVTSFATQNPKGFGLMQRDRDFDHYEDLEARYDLRPSVWVEPRNNWGPGRIELVMIPTPDETNDNVVAYWVPDNPPAPGRSLDYSYRVSWQKAEETRPPTGYALQSRRGHGWIREPDDSVRMIVDFDGPKLRELKPDTNLFGAIWLGDNGELLERQVFRNEVTGAWRLSFRFRRQDPEKAVEMRAYLKNDQDILTETWSYVLAP